MSELNKTQLTAENQASFPNNNTGFITPTILREFNQDMIESLALQSQVTEIQTDLDSLVLSGSGVVVREDSTLLGPATDLNFSGSAVAVTVSGSVATIIIDPATGLDEYTTTASFNAFTASQDSFNTAATASIVALQNFSSSLDATFATDAQLNASSSTLQGNIDTKVAITTFNSYTQSQTLINQGLGAGIAARLLTSSFNAYTQSNDSAISVLQSEVDSLQGVTGSYATTGSNTFNGNQLFNGSLNVTGDITASKLLVQVETSSIIFSSGSNQFGDAADDTQSLYGSVIVYNNLTASGLNYPTADNGEFSFIQTDGNGNLSLQYVNTTNDTVFNGEAFTLVKGTPVYVSGSQGANPKVFAADASDANKMPVIYVIGDDIPTAETGRAIILGQIDGVNTTGYPAGTEIYVGEGGGWSDSRPTGSNSIVQLLGIVTKEGNGGQGLVLNPGPANLPNIQEGYAWVGNSTNQPVAVATSSFGSPIDISALATTGSNTFTGNQTIQNGEKLITDTIEAGAPYGLTIQGQGASINLGAPSYSDPVNIFSSTASIDTNGNKLSVSGSIELTGNIDTPNGVITALDFFGQGGGITNVDALLFDGQDSLTFARTGSNIFTADQQVTGSIDITGDYKINGVPLATSTIDTGSFATTGSNTFTGVNTFEDGINVNQITAQAGGVDGGDITITPYIGGDVIIASDIQVSGDVIVTGSVQTDNINAGVSQLVIDASAGISLAMLGDKLGVSGSIQANGVISSVSGFSGDGSNVTNVNATSLGGLVAARYATTGSNTFTGAQTISSASFSTAISSIAINQTDASGGAGQSKLLGFSANPVNIGGPYASWSPQPTLYGIGSTGPYQIAVFQSQGNFTDGRVSLQRPLVVTGSLTASLQEGYAWVGGAGGVSTAVATSSFGGGSGVGFPFTGSAGISGSLSVNGPINIQSGSATGSVISNLGDTFTEVPPVQKIVSLTQTQYNSLVSGGTTDPNTLYIISGSAIISASFATSASFASNATTASYVLNAVSSSFATTASFASTSAIAANGFPFTGSARITGSLVITGSAEMNVVSLSIVSNTASIDLNAGNYFTGSLSGSVFFNVTNVRPGETAIVKLTTTGVPTASFSSNVRQVSGSAYVATSGSGWTDILTIVSMDTTSAFLLNSKKFI
jgi:hypothetical protein